ncbi:MAG TPA: hypothetical protein VHO71_04990 [Caproiciproducens sp.]|nr:hypothetical protein [Caproiciproducens sp.]
MKYIGEIKANGFWLPSTTTLDFSVEDLDLDAFRTTDGLLHRQRVGKKIKLNCAWQIIPDNDDFKETFNILDNLPEYFTLQFPHPGGNLTFEITAYRGPLSTSLKTFYWDRQSHKLGLWENLKTDFIER